MNNKPSTRGRFSTSIDKGLYEAFSACARDARLPRSRLLDIVLEDYLQKKGVSYTKATAGPTGSCYEGDDR